MILGLFGAGAALGIAVTGAVEFVLSIGSQLMSEVEGAENQRLADQALAETVPLASLVEDMVRLGSNADLVVASKELRLAEVATELALVPVGSPDKEGDPPKMLWTTAGERALLTKYLRVGQRGGRMDWDNPKARALLKLILSQQTTRNLVGPIQVQAMP